MLHARAWTDAAAHRAARPGRHAPRRGDTLILVLAYGNPLRGDDGVAAVAVDGLALPDAEIAVAHQLLPEHADLIARAEGVVFVDARAGGTPGEIVEEDVREGGAPPISHHLAPGHLLALARALHGGAPPAIAIQVCGSEFAHGERLSPTVRGALPSARARIHSAAARLSREALQRHGSRRGR